MGLSLSQKILNNHLVECSLESSNEIAFKIDHCLTQDSTGTMAWLEFESIGLDKVQAEKVVSYCDHTSLSFKGESSDDHIFLQTVASKHGAYFSKSGNGVCHQIHYERFGVPGKTLLGSDSHTPTAGGIGMLGIGVGGMDVATAMAGYPFYIKVPKIMNVNLTGKLQKGVNAKDIILELLRLISVKGGVGYIIEYSGDGIKKLTVPQRATITNMGAETGATTSLFPSDEVTLDFFKKQKRENEWVELLPDENVDYDEVINIDLNKIKPLIAMPGSPDNVQAVSEVQGKPVQQIFIGSCTNGGVEDIKIASEILKGKKISNKIDLIVSPGSKQVLQTLLRDDSIKNLVDAGARIIDPGCNACIGVGFVPGHLHLSLRTVNRNWFGRGGSKDCRISLCSAETAAVSALFGTITDPQSIDNLPEKTEIPGYTIDDNLIVKPFSDGREIKRSPNIIPFKLNSPLSKNLNGKVILKLGDGISTDDILPAGPLTQHLRSNLPEISKFTFYYIDKNFYENCINNNGGFIVGGENYGQGSSREHAALAPNELKIKAVLAKSFARIHRANLINIGILPILCNTDLINQEDELEISIDNLTKSNEIKIFNKTTGNDIPAEHDLIGREIDVVLAGGKLSFVKQEQNS